MTSWPTTAGQEGRALPQFRRLKVGFWIATIVALTSTAAYAVAHTLHAEVPEWVRTTFFYFIPIALPVVAASFISMISINDLQRRVARYREMRAMLDDSRRQITFCQTWKLERLVLRTERRFSRRCSSGARSRASPSRTERPPQAPS